jgi:pyruvate dehydrogenase E2 component (dihydrolipoamide acetyltransferase)
MPIEIQLPRLGWSMEEGTFVAWLKKDGDSVKAGEPLFTLESDKAAQDVEATDNGILRLAPDAPKPGDLVKVGRVLGYLLAEGETPPAPAAPVASEEREPAVALATAVAPVKSESLPPGKPAPSAAVPASPRARRAAKQRDVDLATLEPTGTGGRIRERDVLAAAAAGKPMPPIPDASMQEVAVSPMRRTIAARMMSSAQNTAPVTLTCRCDATRLVALRQGLKSAAGSGLASVVPSYTDIIAKLTASALQTQPMLAGRWDGDRVLLPKRIHIGIAVDTDAGLLVPVIRDVPQASLTEVTRQSQRLIEAARAGKLAAADMQGGCFTITNLGSFGIEAFTPVINSPETAILGLGAILREAIALPDGALTTREQMTLSLTFDHRVVDGAPAARFLQTLRQLIENTPPGCLEAENPTS